MERSWGDEVRRRCEDYRVAWLSSSEAQQEATALVLDTRHLTPSNFAYQQHSNVLCVWGSCGIWDIVLICPKEQDESMDSAASHIEPFTCTTLLKVFPGLDIIFSLGIGQGPPYAQYRDYPEWTNSLDTPEILRSQTFESHKLYTGQEIHAGDVVASWTDQRDGIWHCSQGQSPQRQICDPEIKTPFPQALLQVMHTISTTSRISQLDGIPTQFIKSQEDRSPRQYAQPRCISRDGSASAARLHLGRILFVDGHDSGSVTDIWNKMTSKEWPELSCLDDNTIWPRDILKIPCIVLRGIDGRVFTNREKTLKTQAYTSTAAFARHSLLMYVSPMDWLIENGPTILQMPVAASSALVFDPDRDYSTLQRMRAEMKHTYRATLLSRLNRFRYVSEKAYIFTDKLCSDTGKAWEKDFQWINDQTGRWIEEHPIYQKWSGKTPTKTTVWLVGATGCGKTRLVRRLLDERLKYRTAREIVCHIFFGANSWSDCTSIKALCCILYQILEQSPDMVGPALDQYLEHGDALFENFALLWQILQSILNHGCGGRIWCFLDGLQYCQDTALRDAIHLYASKGVDTNSAFSFFVSTSLLPTDRPKKMFSRSSTDVILFEEDTWLRLVYNVYMSTIMSTTLLFSEAEQNLILDRFNTNPNHTPLWLGLTCANLSSQEGFTAGNMRQTARTMPLKLGEVYNLRAQRVCADAQNRRKLAIALSAFRPLDASEFFAALHMTIKHRSLDSLFSDAWPDIDVELVSSTLDPKSLMTECWPFLYRSNYRVCWRADSARSFLLGHDIDSRPGIHSSKLKPTSSGTMNIASFDMQECHKLMAEICLSFLELRVTKPLTEIKDATTEDEARRSFARERMFAFINYSYTYMFRHISEAQLVKTDTLVQRALTLLTKHGHHFLEAISWDYETLHPSEPTMYHESERSPSPLGCVVWTGCLQMLEAYLDTNIQPLADIDISQFVQAVLIRKDIAMLKYFFANIGGQSFSSRLVSKSAMSSLICLAIQHHENGIANELMAIASISQQHLLHHAVLGRADTIIVAWLVEAGASIDHKYSKRMSLLHVAVTTFKISTIEFLLRGGADVNARDVLELTPLHYAVAFSTTTLIDLLIKYGADVNSVDETGRGALHIGALLRGSEVIQNLLKHRAKLHVKDNNGWTALHFATFANNIGAASVLLAARHPYETITKDGRTPFDIACNQMNVEIIDMMLKHIDDDGMPLEQYSGTPSYSLCVEHIRFQLLQQALDRYLLRLSIYLTTDSASISAAFKHLAKNIFDRQHTRDVAWIFRKLNLRIASDQDLALLLHIAVANLDIEATALALDAGARVNATNSRGQTPLLVVASHVLNDGNETERLSKRQYGRQIVELLLAHDANPEALDETLRSPLCYAIHNTNLELIGLLSLRSLWRPDSGRDGSFKQVPLYNEDRFVACTPTSTRDSADDAGSDVEIETKQSDESSGPVRALHSLSALWWTTKFAFEAGINPRKFQGPSTAEILGRPDEDSPRTIYDRLRSGKQFFLFSSSVSRSFWMEPTMPSFTKLDGPTNVNLATRFWGEVIYRLDSPARHIADLPQSLPDAYHVYLVTAASGISRHSLLYSTKHWSLYTQGCFFNLGVFAFTGDAPKEWTIMAGKHHEAVTRLKREVLWEKTADGWQKTRLEHTDEPFVAIELGQTQYNLEDVNCLADDVLKKMGRYNLVIADCHAFVAYLAVRLVMSKRSSVVFVGNKAQIVEWDLGANGCADSPEAYQSVATGFIVRGPEYRQKKWQLDLRRLQKGRRFLERIVEANKRYKEAKSSGTP